MSENVIIITVDDYSPKYSCMFFQGGNNEISGESEIVINTVWENKISLNGVLQKRKNDILIMPLHEAADCYSAG
jgi:hypothetical protein